MSVLKLTITLDDQNRSVHRGEAITSAILTMLSQTRFRSGSIPARENYDCKVVLPYGEEQVVKIQTKWTESAKERDL